MSGEFGFEAVIRETKEELEINLKQADICFLGASISTNIQKGIINNHFNEYYIANIDIEIDKIKKQDTEVEEVKWVEQEEISSMINDNCKGITPKFECWNYLEMYYNWKNK